MIHTTFGTPSSSRTTPSSNKGVSQNLKFGTGNIVQSGQNFLHHVNTNPGYLNFLGSLAGAATVVVGILSFLNIFNAFHNPLTYVLNIFYIFIGAAMLVTSAFGDSNISQKVYSQANFLSNSTGRTLIYVYLGCLMTSSGFSGKISWLFVIVGIYMLLLAVLSFVVSWKQ
jgi:COPI associated protein